MNNFKVGDKVRCIESGIDTIAGEVYVVRGVYGPDYINVEGSRYYSIVARFKIVDEKPEGWEIP